VETETDRETLDERVFWRDLEICTLALARVQASQRTILPGVLLEVAAAKVVEADVIGRRC
jgi:hypothetical protein